MKKLPFFPVIWKVMKIDEKSWKVMKSDEKWQNRWKVMKSDEKWWNVMKKCETRLIVGNVTKTVTKSTFFLSFKPRISTSFEIPSLRSTKCHEKWWKVMKSDENVMKSDKSDEKWQNRWKVMKIDENEGLDWQNRRNQTWKNMQKVMGFSLSKNGFNSCNH